MIKKALSILSILVALAFTSFAQENCTNGIDDDGDGLIDCDDPDCQFTPVEEKGCNCADGIDNDGDGRIDVNDQDCASYYGLTFVGDDTDCSVPPPASANIFDVSDAPAVSGQNTVDTQSKMAIGDVDGDGVPDVVATSKWNQTLRVIATTDNQADGSDAGDIKASWKTTDPSVGDILKAGGYTFYFDLETLIADVDGDGTAELFATVYQRKNSTKVIEKYYIGRWDYDGTKDLVNTWAVDLGSKRPGIPGVADFDGDGIAEIYLKNRIYSAATGTLLANPGGDWNTEVNSAPVAVNILGDSNLELVSGRYIYSVPSLSSQSLVTLTVAQDMNSLGLAQFYPKVLNDVYEYGITNFSSTSVADFDDDGNIDVFLSGALGSTSGPTTVFYWNVAKGTVGTFSPSHPDVGGVSYPNGWPWGTSRVNLGELDGDGILEANFISGNQLWALEEGGAGTLVELWSSPRTINDSRSGIVSTTVYDFNNDGQSELIYRDSQVLTIVDGNTGQTTQWSTSCQSHTMTEGPIIADVNGDGATDICVPCFRGPGLFKIDGDLSQQALGEIRLFFSSENAWLPTRKVYNQPGYFVVNINDDLTVPYPQLDQALEFGSGACSNGIPGPQQPFNTFLNQVPNISASGCPVYPGPDISFVGTDPDPNSPDYVPPTDPNYFPAVEVIPPICGDLAITVNFNIINDGLRAITSDIPVSFWDGDPENDATAALLHTEVLPVANFAVGDTLSYSGVTFNSTGKAFTLYVVLNDDGTTAPPFALTGQVEECKIDNNIYPFSIVPEPFTVELEIIQDNIKCDDTAPDNGEIRAVVYENGVEAPDYSKYGFQWYNGPDTTSAFFPDPMGKLDRLTGIPEGDYTVIVTNLDKGCASLPIDTTIVRIGQDPVLTIVENSPQTQCSPYNGELEVFVGGGNTGYSFEWFDNLLNPIGVTSSVASGLQAGEYIVAASKSGCTKTQSFTLSGPIFPDAQAITVSNVMDCSDPNSGQIDAEAVVNGVVQDPTNFDFTWYHWDTGTNSIGSQISSIYGTGKSRTGLPIGWYAVVVKNKGTNCESFPPVPTEVQNQTVVPTVTLTELQANSSCDPANPNGRILVEIFAGGVQDTPLNYTIEWFKGDNTLPANQIFTTSGTNGEIVTGVGSAGIPYTAKVTSALNCGTYDNLIVSQNVIKPMLTATPVDNSICNPALAAGGVYNGAVNTVVTFDGVQVTDFTNYTFTWYAGKDINTDPIIAGETSSTLPNKQGGFYTVVVSLDSVSCNSIPVTVEVKDIPVYPTILINETPETTCTGTPNGQLAASVDVGGTPTTTGYTFEWYSGTDTSIPANLIATTTGTENETAIELNGGINYTVKVVNTATGCTNEKTEFLDDNSSPPIITLSSTDNTVCDVNIGFTGSVTAVVTDPNGSLDFLNDYTFNWYIGQNTSGTPIADPDPSTPLILEALEGNFYTLEVVNNVLECTSLPVYKEVIDVPPTINIGTVVTPSTNCSGTGNGSIQAFIDANNDGIFDVGEDDLVNYTFEWYVGIGTGGASTSTQAGNPNIAIDLQGGAGQNYTIRVIENASGCEETATVLLNDVSQTPIITLTPTPNTICDPSFPGAAAAFNGSVTVTVNDLNGSLDFANDYTFTWTDALSNPVADGDPLTPLVLDNVSGGDYSLVLTNDILGCSSLKVTTTVDNTPPVINIATINTASTNCTGTGNGTIQAYIDANSNGSLDPGEDDLVNYTYEWFVGTGTSGGNTTTLAGNPNIATELQGGAGQNYTIKVTDNASGCFETLTILLNDDSELPVVTLVPSDNKGCTPGLYTGSVTATVTYKGVDVTASGDYTFNWTSSDVGFTPTNTALISGLKGTETYTLTAINTVLGCTALDVTATVDDNLDPITVFFTNTKNTSCDVTGNGEILAGIDLNSNNALDAGEDNLANLSDYNFTWHVGNTTTGILPTSIPSVNNIDQLDGNEFYTLEVERISTGCKTTYTEWVQKTITIPDISVTATDYVDCQTTAKVSVQINNIGSFDAPLNTPSDFTYRWYFGVDSTGTEIDAVSYPAASFAYTANGQELTSLDGVNPLPASDYAVYVSHNNSTCSSDVKTDRLDQPPAPLFTITDLSITPSSVCNTTDGSIQVTVVEAGSYTYEWFAGAPNNSPPATYYTDPQVAFNGASIGLSSTLNNVGDGSYTVVVTNASGCKEFKTFYVPFLDAQVVGATVVQNVTDCTNPNNGEIFVEITNLALLVAPGNDDRNYIFDLYSGSSPVIGVDAPIDTKIPASLGAGVTFTNLAEGNYTTIITQNFGAGCISEPKIATIENWAYPPIVSLSGSINPNTSCDAASPDGSLTINIKHHPDEQSADLTTDPTYTITATPDPIGSGLTPAPQVTAISDLINGEDITLNGLSPTSYIIEVASSRGCTTFKTFEVPDEPVVTDVNSFTVVDEATCSNTTSSITVDGIEEIGTGNVRPVSDFEFSWYIDDGNGVFDEISPDYTENGLAGPAGGAVYDASDPNFAGAGDYWLIMSAINGAGIGCPTAPIKFTIKDLSVEPTFTYEITANTSCDITQADGTLYINPDRNSPDPLAPGFSSWTLAFSSVPADYDVNAGGTVPTPLGLTAPTPDVGTEAGVYAIQGLLPGLYEFIITDVATNCSIVGSLNIPNNPVPPILDNIVYATTDQFTCNGDGEIRITQIETVTSGTAPSVVISSTPETDMDHYTFTWYHDANGNGILDDPATRSNIQGGLPTNGEIYQTADPGFVGAGTYWVEMTKIIADAGEGGVGCTSVPYKFKLEDLSVNPTFTYDVTANTSCVGGPDGTLSIDPGRNGATTAFAQWEIEFSNDPSGTLGGTTVLPGVNDTFFASALPDGQYDFTIKDASTGCITNGAAVIATNPVPPVLENNGYTITDQAICLVDGSIEITSITTVVGGAAPSTPVTSTTDLNMANYSFTWYLGSTFNTAAPIAATGNLLDQNDAGFVGAGTYWVEITKVVGTSGLGCTSTPYKFTVKDVSVDPVISFAQTSNTACDLAQANGSITAMVTTSGAPIPAGSTFSWYVGPNNSSPAFTDGVDGNLDQSFVGQETINNAAPGIYTVEVTDLATGCSVFGSFSIEDQPAIPTLTLDNATVVDQTICNPSGSITINDADITLFDPNTGLNVPVTAADFSYLWYRDSPNTTPLEDAFTTTITGPTLIAGNNAGEYPTMGAGTYYVQLVPTGALAGLGAGCYGPPVSKVIFDVSTDPVIAFSTTVNSSCDITNPNGSVSATVNEVSGTPDTYSSYVWTYNGGALPASVVQLDGVNTSVLTSAPEGNYSLTLVNNVTGCSTSGGTQLILDLSISEPNIITVDKTDPLDCLNSGTMEVTEVYVGGFPANVADFEFDWYAGTIDPANLLPDHTALVINVGPGQYFVIARDLNTQCESIEKEVDILDDQIIYPTVEIAQDRPQTSCDLMNPNGSLSATVDGGNNDTNPNYTFNWYAGPVPTGNPADILATTSTITSIADGEYTVEVFSALSGCSNTSTYILEDGTEEFRLQVSVTVLPVTLCNTDDGVLEARVINHPTSPNFMFTWTGSGGFTATGDRVNNVPPGPYQVTAVDLTGEYCPSLVEEGIVEDLRQDPPIDVVLNNPLTNCDPAKPNGQLSATVDGHVGGYTFSWYDGPDTSGPVTHVGNIYSQLGEGTYTVQVVDLATQCVNQASEDVTNGQLTPPSPTPIVIQNLTDCEFPNGEVEASVNGDRNNYLFDWYNGSSVGSTPDGGGYSYGDLDLGDYTVTATDIKTGCVSAGVTVPVIDERVYPEFDYKIAPANCETDNGAVELVFNDAYNLRGVTWYDENGSQIDVNTNLYGVVAGDYSVTVTTFLGCQADGEVTIPTEITNYNGISANGDGSNDDFQIDCITLFPNNNVKIYNRAGIKVYEADHYNNDDIVFDGTGQRGVYPFGENLPDGTYFYIIDKGDGSRPKTGYLELIR